MNDWDAYESHIENNPYTCRECHTDVPASIYKHYDGFCRECAKALRLVSIVDFSYGKKTQRLPIAFS